MAQISKNRNRRRVPRSGGEARIIGAVGVVFWVKCAECGAETQNELSEQQAAEAWNRRADNE
ncbi:Lar family restriction alleviation protein [Ruminococcus sp. CLA-AA-H200]|uniref:Lar family restriction alleviation protein n=1 Tax=Ruminococcus turbiniformis TaxID=2881258 RepID=A0ABS8G1D7_9FIRM|nr:Lar family restriction alleviation protein [Ruminococcus turbiniformis]